MRRSVSSTAMWRIRNNLIASVVDGQHCSAADQNLGFAAALLRQPEVSSLCARITDRCPRDPERRILRRRRIYSGHGEVLRIYPDFASIQELACLEWRHAQNVCRPPVQALGPQ